MLERNVFMTYWSPLYHLMDTDLHDKELLLSWYKPEWIDVKCNNIQLCYKILYFIYLWWSWNSLLSCIFPKLPVYPYCFDLFFVQFTLYILWKYQIAKASKAFYPFWLEFMFQRCVVDFFSHSSKVVIIFLTFFFLLKCFLWSTAIIDFISASQQISSVLIWQS